MAKLKIGLFIDTWFPMIDGVINVVNNYATELSKYADVTVFTCGTKKKDNKTYPFKLVRGGSVVVPFLDYEVPTINPKFQKALKESNLDIVHIHSPFTIGKAGVEYAEKHKIPVVATLHSQYYKDFYRYTKSKWLSESLLKVIVKVFNACDKVYAVNSQVAVVGEEYGIVPKPDVHNNGTHLDYIQNTAPAYEYFEKKYGIGQNETVLLFVGRINKIKNLEFLIESLSELDKLGEKFRMLFVGSGGDMDDLKAKVKKLGLEGKIIFTGRASDEELIYAYVRSKLFLFPSLYDASSLVQIEAASQKTPTVFIRGAVTSATVTEDVNGYMADNDTLLYAKKVQQILRDHETYARISQSAYEDLYITWDKTVARMYQKYLSVIDRYKDELYMAEMQEKRAEERKKRLKETIEKRKKHKAQLEKDKKEKEKLKKQKEKLIGESKKQKKEKLLKEKELEKLALKEEKLRLQEEKLLKAKQKLEKQKLKTTLTKKENKI